MKRIALLFMLALPLTIFTSCEGDPGPPGPPGLDGTSLLGTVFEVNANFNASNEFRNFFSYPSTLQVFDSDVVLVYLLEETTPEGLDVWSLCPQTFFTPNGSLVYNFDYTAVDVSIYLYADFDLNFAGPEFTQNQILRVAVVPADFGENINIFDMEAVMDALNVSTDSIERLEFD
ncbi:collagen-like protein [Gilvibacter sp.]|uniref:collagen-like protein n=1 Tax=Gilvibacter sp. TaxID=2729997 RepID=UPI0025BFDEB7|nr:collagen-like protein [Gilvibacter sp.]NQX78395.1 collagen-like protein [Gilvibacter sp.]